MTDFKISKYVEEIVPIKGKIVDHSGKVLGRLFVIKPCGRIYSTDTGKMVAIVWECRCSCGNITKLRANEINRGVLQSCGCIVSEQMKQMSERHGLSKHPYYKSYTNMVNRCYNTEDKQYNDYGGRGIKVCNRWLEKPYKGLENFLKDMDSKDWSDGSTLDRINVEGDYTPNNCRWANRTIQSFNRRLMDRNKTGKTGVYYREDMGKYVAGISFKKVQYHLGSFSSFDEARQARENAEIFYYGEVKDE